MQVALLPRRWLLFFCRATKATLRSFFGFFFLYLSLQLFHLLLERILRRLGTPTSKLGNTRSELTLDPRRTRVTYSIASTIHYLPLDWLKSWLSSFRSALNNSYNTKRGFAGSSINVLRGESERDAGGLLGKPLPLKFWTLPSCARCFRQNSKPARTWYKPTVTELSSLPTVRRGQNKTEAFHVQLN